jgi:excinuclease ABC subunit B
MTKFKLKADYKAVYDQKKAIEKLVKGVNNKEKYQVLLGVTGSGKTFSVANVIEQTQKPTLIISHNKTLAGQLYQEFRDYFPDNAVSYFVSYYDYYQPEAYIPSTDTYIEKDADVNELIDKLRLAATTNLMTRKDVIVVASVSCIYNIGSPREYGNYILDIYKDMPVVREQIIDRLLDLQYQRSEFGFHRGTFRVRGDNIDIYPAYRDVALNIELLDKKIKKLSLSDPISGELIKKSAVLDRYVLYPAKHFITDPRQNQDTFAQIRKDLVQQVKKFKAQGKELEAHRLQQKVTYELEMLTEVGYVKGIENYSRYFDGRSPGDPPYSLLDYYNERFGNDWLVFIDESHMSIPQIRGMYAGDLSRKQTLIDYGFRLPAALDNRPLRFDEFMRRIPGFIATSATPAAYELSLAGKKNVVEQLMRPTGITDPEVEIRPTKTQVADVIEEIKKRIAKKQRTLVTTLTKKTAEDIAEHLATKDIRVHYLHSDMQTLDRSDVLDKLRSGDYDVIVGINLLREGLDLPEVALVAILDADKEGFLRSEVALVQTMGRAARHIEGKVILYADNQTGSIKRALKEVRRRRQYQLAINKKYGIKPTQIVKPIREKLIERDEEVEKLSGYDLLADIDIDSLTPMDKKRMSRQLKREMRLAAEELNFELAIEIRDKLKEIES